MPPLEVGSIAVRLGALFDDRGFDRFDRAVRDARSTRDVEAALRGDYKAEDFRKFDRALDASQREARRGAEARLRGDVDRRGFSTFDRLVGRARRERDVEVDLRGDLDRRGFQQFDRAVASARREKDVRVDLKADVDKRGFQQFDQATNRATTGARRTSGGLLALGKGAGVAAGAAGVGGLALGLRAMYQESSQAALVGAQTNAVLKSTGGEANVTKREIEDLASALSRKSGKDDEAIQAGQNLLLTFRDVRNEAGEGNDIFNQSTVAVEDMATAMGMDSTNAALQLGKALNDPLKGMGRLQRIGVTFTDDQKKQVEALTASGDRIGAQKVILAELTKEFGGSAEAAGNTFPGAINKAKEGLNNFLQDAGTKAAPAISKLANGFAGLFAGKGSGGAAEFGRRIRGELADLERPIKRLAATVGRYVSAIGDAFSDVFGGGSGMGKDLATVGRALRGWAAIVMDVYSAVVKRAIPGIAQAFRGLFQTIRGVVRIISGILSGDFKKVWAGLKDIVVGPLRVVSGLVRAFTAPFRELLSRAARGAVGAFKKVFGGLAGAVGDAFSAVWRFLKRVPGRLKDFAVDGARAYARAWKKVWGTVADVVGDALGGVWRLLKRVPGRLKDFAVDGARAYWRALKSGFGRVVGVVRDALGEAWDYLKSLPGRYKTLGKNIGGAIGDGMKAGVRGLAGVAKSIMNGVIDTMNTAIRGINKITPGKIKLRGLPDIPGIPDIPSIPRLAAGGDVLGAGAAVVGEAGPELLSLPRGARVAPLPRGKGGPVDLADPLERERRRVEPIVKKIREDLGTIRVAGRKSGEGTAKDLVAQLDAGGKRGHRVVLDATGKIVDRFGDMRKGGAKESGQMTKAVVGQFESLRRQGGAKAKGLADAVEGRYEALRRDATKHAASMRKAVVDKFEDTRKDGSTKARRLRDNVDGHYGSMRRETAKHMRSIAGTTTDKLDDARRAASSRSKRIRDSVASGYESMDRAVFKGVSYVQDATSKALSGLGGKPVKLDVPKPKGLARGGMARAAGGWLGRQGERGGDTELVLMGRGEAVLNRHQQEWVNAALANTFGISLGGLFERERRVHYMARGGMVPIPGEPGATIHPAILGDVVALKRKYKLNIGDGYAASGHSAAGEHPLGLAIDATPGAGGSWGLIDRLAAWAEPSQNNPRHPFRWVGYTGDANHGSGNHIHLSWKHNGKISTLGGSIAADFDVPKIKVAGPRGQLLDIAQRVVDKVRAGASSHVDSQMGELGGIGLPGGDPGSGSNLTIGKRMMSKIWPLSQWPALRSLWHHESGWSETADNPTSDAYGIPQSLPGSKMASAGPDWRTNPVTQIKWGLGYIRDRYGSPSRALAAWQSRSPHWYSRGGIVRAAKGKPPKLPAAGLGTVKLPGGLGGEEAGRLPWIATAIEGIGSDYELQSRRFDRSEEVFVREPRDEKEALAAHRDPNVLLNWPALKRRKDELTVLRGLREKIVAKFKEEQRQIDGIVKSYRQAQKKLKATIDELRKQSSRLKGSKAKGAASHRKAIGGRISSYLARYRQHGAAVKGWQAGRQESVRDWRFAREDVFDLDKEMGALIPGALSEARGLGVAPEPPPAPDAAEPAEEAGGGEAAGETGIDPAEVARQAREMFAAFTAQRSSLFGGFGSNFYQGSPGLDPGTVAAGFRQFGAFGQVAGRGDGPVAEPGGLGVVQKVEVVQHFAAPPLDAHTWTADLKHEVQAQL